MTETHGKDHVLMDAETFNQRFPVGTPVHYWPGVRDLYHPELRRHETATRTPAWTLGRGAVVSLDGWPGGIALTNVEPRCLCDGGAYEVKAHPFIVHPACPVHITPAWHTESAERCMS